MAISSLAQCLSKAHSRYGFKLWQTSSRCLLFTGVVIWGAPLLALSPTPSAKLEKIERKISTLHSEQKSAYRTQRELTHELKQVELQINALSKQLANNHDQRQQEEQALIHFDLKVEQLKQTFNEQQQQLSKELLAYYQLKQKNYLALLLNQKEPALSSRLMSYIGYLNKAHTEKLQRLQQMKQQIKEQQQISQRHLDTLKQLGEKKQQLNTQLQEEKRLQQEIIASLSHQIAARQLKLKQLIQNKEALEEIIRKIKLQQLGSTTTSFAKLKRRLPWPTEGQLVQPKERVGAKGIYIQAPEGRQVIAVTTGKVVFADWLNGYGLLIILEHSQGYMSLYANNQALYKTKGEMVSAGEKIAAVGHSGGQLANGLYFEIRKSNTPLNPLAWLRPHA